MSEREGGKHFITRTRNNNSTGKEAQKQRSKETIREGKVERATSKGRTATQLEAERKRKT